MAQFGLPDDFFEQYWRRRPLHIAGGAAAFLFEPPSRETILSLIDSGAPHQTDGSTVWFLEGLTDGLPGFAELVAEARRLFEWHDVWCDVFATVGPSSIGCHYDGSDNFSLQLAGNKDWYLCSPRGIHADDIRRRLLGEPGLGPAPVPESAQLFRARAGDALYIPSTWIHWGLSDGDSTSVSLVVNVASAYHVLHAQILDSLRHDSRWWTPLPVGPGSAAARERVLRELVATDLPSHAQTGVCARLRDREGSRLSPRSLLGVVMPAVPAGTGERLTSYLGHPGTADLGRFDIDDDQLMLVSRRLARRNLERLLRQCARRAPQTSDEDARRIYAVATEGIPALPSEALDDLLIDPDAQSWISMAEKDLDPARLRAEDPLAHALGLALLPELVGASDRFGPVTVAVPVDEDGALTLRRHGLRLRFQDQPARVVVGGLDGMLHYFGPTAVPLTEGTDHGGLAVDRLPRAGLAVVSTARPDWLGRVSPGRQIGLRVPDDEVARRADAVRIAIVAVSEGVPARDPFLAWVLVRRRSRNTEAIAPTVPRMRGLAVTTESNPDRLTWTLAQARAWHEIDSLMELSPLVDGDRLAVSDRTAREREIARSYVWARTRHLEHLRPGRAPDAGPGSAGWEPDRVVPTHLTPVGLAVWDVVESASG